MRVRIVCDKCGSDKLVDERVEPKEVVLTMGEWINRRRSVKGFVELPRDNRRRIMCRECGHFVVYEI